MTRMVAASILALAVVAQPALSGDAPSAAPPTEAERLLGLARLRKEAEYNFVFFDHVPGLDWDAAFAAYAPQVREAKDTLAYYRALQRFAALLKDGHTGVQFPRQSCSRRGRPARQPRTSSCTSTARPRSRGWPHLRQHGPAAEGPATGRLHGVGLRQARHVPGRARLRGCGILPQLEVAPSIDDARSGRDPVLDRGLAVLREAMRLAVGGARP